MKKKLLFINGHLNTGGVEKALVDILTHLDYDKYDVDLLLTETMGDYTDQLPQQVNVLLHSMQGTYGPLLSTLIKCVCRRDWFCLKMRSLFLLQRCFGDKMLAPAEKLLTGGKHYDCVIGFRRGVCTQIAAHAVTADRRITWWHHGLINVETVDYLKEVENMHRVVAVSKNCCNMLVAAMPCLEGRLATVYNMLNPDVVRAKAEHFRPYAGDDLIHIVSVGGLVPEKHFENAIWAARKLKEAGVAFQWHLVGDGVLREDLQQKAEAAGVTDCFTLEGNQPNPYPYVKNADLFVHPSYVESFGIVVAEAMALGVPCVVTKSLGPCEFIKDGVNGLLTEQSAEDLAEKVLEILQNRELYERIRNNTRCPEQFLPERVMEKIEELLEE